MRRKDKEVTDRTEIEKIIQMCKICHLAMVDGDMPYVVPMNFGYLFLEDGTLELHFHGAYKGKKMDVLGKNNKVCFEMTVDGGLAEADEPCDTGYYFSSVIGYGKVHFIEEHIEKGKVLSSMLKHQTGREVAFGSEQLKNVCVYKIVSTEYTGKQKSRPVSL